MSRLNAWRSALKPTPLGPQTLSLEEDAMLITSAADDLNRIDTELSEIRRLQDTATVLQDVKTVGGNIQKATVSDLFMIESSARLATAGSDIPYESVTPALERYEGRRLGLEGLGSFIDSIWKGIVDAMKAVWNAVKDFFYKIFGTIPRMRRSIEDIQTKAESGRTDLMTEPTLKLGPEIGAMMRNDKLPRDGVEIVDGLDLLAQTTEYYLGEFTQVAEQVYENARVEMDGFDERDLDRSLNRLSDIAMTLSARNAPGGLKISETKDPRFADNEYINLPHLPGNRTIYIRRVAIPERSDALGRADAIQLCICRVMDSKPRAKQTRDLNGTINMPNNAEVLQMCTLMDNILNYVEKFGRGKDFASIEKSKEVLVKASTDLVARSRDMPPANPAQGYYRAAIKFNTYLTSTVVQPLTAMASLSLSTVRAGIVIGQKAVGITTFF